MFGKHSQGVTAVRAIHVVVELYTDLRRSTANNWAEKAYSLSLH